MSGHEWDFLTTLSLLIVACKLIKSCYSPWCKVGDCGLFFWSFLAFVVGVLSLRVDKQFSTNHSWGSAAFVLAHFTLLPTFPASPSIINIHLSDYFSPFSASFLYIFFSVIFPPPLFSPQSTLFPARTQLEHISTCISSDYQPYIHTHSRWALTQRSGRTPTDRQEADMMQCNPAQTHVWLISWCNGPNSLSSSGNTWPTVNLFTSNSKHVHSSPNSNLCLFISQSIFDWLLKTVISFCDQYF